ncbi:UNVERIFIED_CONTAM: hypothetical protein Sradi_7201200 [Sesamum radiatum]|uniref:Uncharacterized protein n=1 Tax=Sesamum radiatum TaxID=300843 RepID=A0AAW2IPP5_SESRA
MHELLVENMARTNYLPLIGSCGVHGSEESTGGELAEIGRLEAAIRQQKSHFSQVNGERGEALENIVVCERRFERELSTEKKFLASASSVAFTTKTQEEAISKFQESDEFENNLTDRVKESVWPGNVA